ncbi:MAG: hypothetical protein EA379_04690 [Phycisphaerales bacterium]|jgi:pilus assembly protein Flp/PilA|nr:MAG: hypothetical protein EA379_04690 [Phycisphaerales bacterium]
MLQRLLRNRKGQGFVEYALLVAGVALVGAIGVTILGDKTNEMISSVATVLPGANPIVNSPISAGAMIEFDVNADGSLIIDLAAITANSDGNQPRLSDNLGIDTADFTDLVITVHPF